MSLGAGSGSLCKQRVVAALGRRGGILGPLQRKGTFLAAADPYAAYQVALLDEPCVLELAPARWDPSSLVSPELLPSHQPAALEVLLAALPPTNPAALAAEAAEVLQLGGVCVPAPAGSSRCCRVSSQGPWVLLVQLPGRAVPRALSLLARLPFVAWIGPHRPPSARNWWSGSVVQGLEVTEVDAQVPLGPGSDPQALLDAKRPLWDLGINGSTQIVGPTDVGTSLRPFCRCLYLHPPCIALGVEPGPLAPAADRLGGHRPRLELVLLPGPRGVRAGAEPQVHSLWWLIFLRA